MAKSWFPRKKKRVPTNSTEFGHSTIAKWILFFGLSSVSVLGVTSIICSAFKGSDAKVVDSIKDILNMTLPLIGAWVGTVLAFYFSKENFKAASDSTRDLYTAFSSSEEKLKTIRVTDVMIKEASMTKLKLDKDEKDYKLKADIIDGILEKDKSKPFNRLPVLMDNLYPKYVIHRSLFDKFLVKMTMAGKKIEDLTLAEMTGDPEFGKILNKSFATIKESSTLADVKHVIDTVADCQDVFVTETGESNSKVIGWITNVIVAKASVI